ncbi:MAG: hypothetical protein KGI09_08820, partial [Thaumarchaeota archaeon]|nr:hypothetical protein [Nitrososphaerota archaeon]
PPNQGKFVVFTKVVAFSYSKPAYYPRKGTKDHQNEFVNSYDVLVEEMAYEKEEALTIPKDEVKAVERKAIPSQIVSVAASKPSWIEQLKKEYDQLLAQLVETRQEITTTRKEIEDLKSMFKR